MSRAQHTYRVQVLREDGWATILEDRSRLFCWVARRTWPPPRLAHRLVRDDGKIDPWTENEYLCPECAAYERGTKEAENELERVKAELKRARAAGRRLAAYWRTQADGADWLRDAMAVHWRTKIGEALGLDRPLLSEQVAAIGDLRAELERVKVERDQAQAERDHFRVQLRGAQERGLAAEARAEKAEARLAALVLATEGPR